MYFEGNGLKKSFTEAFEWFKKSALQRNSKAQFFLGLCYDRGFGVNKSTDTAIKWYKKAALQGHATAQYYLGFYYDHNTEEETKGVEWYKKAAFQGLKDAQYELAAAYNYGCGVEKWKERAVEWYKKAALQGDKYAQCNLGKSYCHGKGAEKSTEKAIEWFWKASLQGDYEAIRHLGEMDEATVTAVISRSKVDLTKVLNGKIDGDIQVGGHLVHSFLLSLRCPVLLSTPLTISSTVLDQLLVFVYGGSLCSPFSLKDLIELYQWVSLHLLDHKMEVLHAISQKVKQTEAKEVLETLRLCDECNLNDVFEIGLERMVTLSPSVSEDQLTRLLEEVKSSKKMDCQVFKIHACVQTDASFKRKRKKKEFQDTKTLGDHLKMLLESETGSDFTLVVGNTRLAVHQFVLSARNEYFRALLQPYTLEFQRKESSLSATSLSVSSAKKVLEFLYSGVPPQVNPKESFEILRSKDFLCLDDSPLIEACLECLESPLHCLETFLWAFKLNEEEALMTAAELAAEHFNYLNFRSLSEEWTEEALKKFLTLVQKQPRQEGAPPKKKRKSN